ncbi:MAG TPA: hypothetical protein PK987_08960 [Ferruginibacter sp.]|nr:hypothetical protein [Ferruginibacter sp.]
MHYNFVLKDNNAKAYRLFTWFLFFLHLAVAGIILYNTASKNERPGIYLLTGFYILIALLYFITRKQKYAFETFSFTMALFYASFWVKYVGVLAAFIFVAVFLFVNFIHKKKTKLLVTDAGVQLIMIFKTIVYNWADIDNLVLKDGLLTIDLKSNKLVQTEVTKETKQVDETAFNKFCSMQLNK